MPDLGKKFECYNCGTKFYNLGRPEAICPKCGANQKDARADEAPPPPPRPPRAHISLASQTHTATATITINNFFMAAPFMVKRISLELSL